MIRLGRTGFFCLLIHASGGFQSPSVCYQMLSLAKKLKTLPWCFEAAGNQLRWIRTEARSPRRRSRSPALAMRKAEEKSEWWIVDGEMHEVGDHVPPRERFVIPRDNIPNKRRKQLREQFMRRTRLVLKETVSSPSIFQFIGFYLPAQSR